MLDISFELNGKKVNPNNIGDALTTAVMNQYVDYIKKSVGSLSCTEHHKVPKVIVKGKSLDNLSIEVSGCCDDIIKKVTEKLK